MPINNVLYFNINTIQKLTHSCKISSMIIYEYLNLHSYGITQFYHFL